MKERREARATRDTRERRRQVERCLARSGLLRGPRRLSPDVAYPPSGEAFGERLGHAMADLGGGFTAFGDYLASRADLLTASDCLALAAAPKPAPMGVRAVDERLLAELGAGSRDLFSVFEGQPHAIGLFDQSHRATLRDGRPAIVRVGLAGAARLAAQDLELLPLCQRAFPDRRFPFAEVHADFARDLAVRQDLLQQAEALRALAGEAAGSELLAVPEVVAELTTRRVLTVLDLGGLALEELAEKRAGRAVDAHELARRLALVFFRQALGGRRFPLAADAARLDDGRVALSGGVFAEVEGTSQTNLREYLDATARHDSERLSACLLRELGAPPRSAAALELARRLRQRVPRRDGALSLEGESLAEHLVLHWREARECGFRLEPPLSDFYRGLFQVSLAVHRLAGAGGAGRDLLREALMDQSWLTDWEHFQQFGDPIRMAAALEGYLTAFSALPQQLDRILDARQGSPESSRRGAPSPRRNASATVTSLGLVMVALVLVMTRISESSPAARWAERLGTLVFLGLGALLLRAATSRR